MLKEIILIIFIFNYAHCLPLEWDTSRLFFTPDFAHLSSIPEYNGGGVFLRNVNGFDGDFIPYSCHTTVTETPVLICLDPGSDMIFLSSSPFPQEPDHSIRSDVGHPNTCILTITETLLIDLPDDPYNGMFFGCEGFPQTTFIDLEYFSEPEKSILESCTIPPSPPVLGCGKYLRQITIQPPYF